MKIYTKEMETKSMLEHWRDVGTTEEALNERFGSDVWQKVFCNHCRQYGELAIQFDIDTEDGDRIAICLDCLQKAVALAGGAS